MGRKRAKQYLMLLLAVGVIAVVASGSGTFASFNAEVTNGGNTFATGSLILNNTNGTTTCTSAFGTGGSSNQGNGVDCATLFNNVTFTPLHAVADGTNTQSTITLTSIGSGAIYKGDKLIITPTSGSPFTVTTTNAAPVTTATTVGITPALTSTFTGATVLDASPTSFADVKLENAGTIDANDVTLTPTSCTAAYGEGAGTLGTGNAVTVNTTITGVPFTGTGTFAAGEPVVVSDGTHSQTLIASGPPVSNVIPIQGGTQKWNFSYPDAATVTGPQFAGNSPANICTVLKLSVVEEPVGTFPSTTFASASGCVYGTGGAGAANTNACDLTLGQALSAPTAQALGGTLLAGATRYFEVAVHVDGSSFDNTYQNLKSSAFSLKWHIDQ